MLGLVLKGCAIGFSIAMPVGPIGILCIRHSLNRGMSYGIVSGMGAAFADAIFGAIAGLGVSAISNLMMTHSLWLQLIGALFLCFLGYTNYRAKPQPVTELAQKSRLFSTFMTTFFLTLTNPLTILSFAGIYAGLGIGLEDQEMLSVAILTLGVFLGSALWWLFLSWGASHLGKKVNLKNSAIFNKISGAVIFGFGVVAFGVVLKNFMPF